MENKRLTIDKIEFGKTDAYTELRQCGTDYFIDSFVFNPKYRTEDFLEGKKYYLCGKKGTGKTAFLRYLECKFKNDTKNLTFTIRFKSDIDQLDKENFYSINSSDENDENNKYDTKSIISLSSYELVWKTFLINQIITRANMGEYSIFVENENYNTLVVLLKCLYGDNSETGVIMPKIKKGAVEITASFIKSLSTSLKLELEFDERKKRINYQRLSKKIYDLFIKLQYSYTPVYVLIDELELSVANKAQHEKDIELVRDLILAVDSLNTVCSDHCFNIHFIASVRSEVLSSVKSSGYELTKPIEDCGQEVNWFQKGGNYQDNPLLKIIENKIHASERLNQLPITSNVWNTYFDKTINGEETRKYILNNSLYRPRDVIRMMLAIQNEQSSANKFNQEVFDKAQQEYSRKMWNELTDELRLTYSENEIESIFTLFNRITLPFSYNSLIERIKDLGDIYPNIKEFFDKEPLINVLNKMYDLGIIGNTGARMNFVFLECNKLDPLDPMVIHTPLRNFFSVQFEK